MVNVNLFAFQIYQVLKKAIPTLPSFWFELVERDENFLLFRLNETDSNFNKYFNDVNYRVSFQIVLSLKSNQKFHHMEILKKVIHVLVTVWTLPTFEITQMKINNNLINRETQALPFLTFTPLSFADTDQNYFFNVDYLITTKGV